MAWLRRMFRRQPDQDRLMKLEQRADAAESQVEIAKKRAESVLTPEAARRAQQALRPRLR